LYNIFNLALRGSKLVTSTFNHVKCRLTKLKNGQIITKLGSFVTAKNSSWGCKCTQTIFDLSKTLGKEI